MKPQLTPVSEERHEIFDSTDHGRVRRITSDGHVRWEQLVPRDAINDPLYGLEPEQWTPLSFGLGGDAQLDEADILEQAYLKRLAPPVGALFTGPSRRSHS